MNRIEKLFQDKKDNILSIYFTAGFPELNSTLEVLKYLDAAGVDMVEIGFPFSDPLADGPVIQQSSTQAIENGMRLEVLFEQLAEVRNITRMPVVLMGYLNPVLQFGIEKFLKKCAEIGIDGLILPDLPLEFFESKMKPIVEELDIKNILLITPETSEERIRKIDALAGGFIYMVSSNSITGGTHSMQNQTSYFQRIKDMNLNHPTMIGFGIHDYETFSNACRYSSGAIIGTAFIKHLETHGLSQTSVDDFVQNLKNPS